MAEHRQTAHEEYLLLDYQSNQSNHLHHLRERQIDTTTTITEDSPEDYLLLDRPPTNDEPSSDYLLLGRQEPSDHEDVANPSPTPAPSTTKAAGESLPTVIIPEENGETLRIRQAKPTSSQHHSHISTSNLHSKSNRQDHSSSLPLPPSDSQTTLQFYDLRAGSGLQIYGLSPDNDADIDFVPLELVELHKKNAREKNGKNPDSLPEVWRAPPAPDTQDNSSGENGGDDEVELVQRAPDQETADSDAATASMCRTIRGKYGERDVKNPGVILRYQYELIQDTDDIVTYDTNGFVDGTEYLVENIVPSLEQGVGDVLVEALFEECGGGMKKKKRGRGLRRGRKEEEYEVEWGRRELKSTVVGLDGEPEDFPLGQGGESVSMLCSYIPLALSCVD